MDSLFSPPLLPVFMAMSPDTPSPSPRLVFGLIMGGMAVWGVYVAIGAYLYNHNPWRGVIVMACVGLFIGSWALLLRTQKRRGKSSAPRVAFRGNWHSPARSFGGAAA